MKPILRILLIEDNMDDALLVVREVERLGYDVQFERVQTGDEMRSALTAKQWDAVLADYSLPHFSGSDALTILQESGLDLPFIVVSGSIGEESAVQLMRGGASDYIMKEHLSRLGSALQRELREADVRRHRRDAERALARSEERYHTFIDVTTDLVFLKDESFRYIVSNSANNAFLGRSECDMLGHTDFDLMDNDAAMACRATDQKALAEGKGITSYETVGSKAYQSVKFPVPLPDGHIGVGGYIRDVTELKQAQAEREALQAQLYQAQKLDAIGELAGGVAHDFNNLLTGILGNVGMMRGDLPATSSLVSNLDAIEGAARQAADLAKGLLTFGRKAMVRAAPLDMVQAIDASLRILKQSLPATIDIVRDIELPSWNVMADPSQITQVLMNLAVNARDAMEGKGTLTVRLRNELVGENYVRAHAFARTGEFVHLSVSDTGPGIPAEIQAHLFEPFFTTKAEGHGTGLGLSIVYGAVKQADGWVTAESPIGSGAVVDIFLPRCLEQPTAPAAPASTTGSTDGGTVLVVEDEEVVLTVTAAILKRAGYTPMTAENGAAALRVLQEHLGSIDLILLDMTMPGMTTQEIVPALRALSPTVPIVLTSGFTSNRAVQRMLEDGTVQGFLGKPYPMQELTILLGNVLRH